MVSAVELHCCPKIIKNIFLHFHEHWHCSLFLFSTTYTTLLLKTLTYAPNLHQIIFPKKCIIHSCLGNVY